MIFLTFQIFWFWKKQSKFFKRKMIKICANVSISRYHCLQINANIEYWLFFEKRSIFIKHIFRQFIITIFELNRNFYILVIMIFTNNCKRSHFDVYVINDVEFEKTIAFLRERFVRRDIALFEKIVSIAINDYLFKSFSFEIRFKSSFNNCIIVTLCVSMNSLFKIINWRVIVFDK